MTSANVRGRYLRYSASATRTSYPSGPTGDRRPLGQPRCRPTKGPPVHPSEPAYPCCLPALGRFTRCTPHERLSITLPAVRARRAGDPPSAHSDASVSWLTEDSPSGLGRTLGKRVGGNPSRVRISYPPPSANGL